MSSSVVAVRGFFTHGNNRKFVSTGSVYKSVRTLAQTSKKERAYDGESLSQACGDAVTDMMIWALESRQT